MGRGGAMRCGVILGVGEIEGEGVRTGGYIKGWGGAKRGDDAWGENL